MIYSALKGDMGDESIFEAMGRIDGAIDLCLKSLSEEGYSNLNVNVRVDDGVYYVIVFPVDGESGEPIGGKIQRFDQG